MRLRSAPALFQSSPELANEYYHAPRYDPMFHGESRIRDVVTIKSGKMPGTQGTIAEFAPKMIRIRAFDSDEDIYRMSSALNNPAKERREIRCHSRL